LIATVNTSVVAAITDTGISGVMSALVVATLIIFLVAREMAGGGSSASRLFARFLTVGIVPLLLVFTVMLVVTVVGILA